MSDFKKAANELHDVYNRLHPQILSEFEDEMPKYWGSKPEKGLLAANGGTGESRDHGRGIWNPATSPNG